MLNSPDGGLPLGRSPQNFPWVSTDGQGTKCHRNIAKNFNRLTRAHEHYRRQTDRRTFAKKYRVISVLGNSRSSAMSTFSKVHTTSCSPWIETMCLNCTIFEMSYFSIKSQFFLPPSVFGTPNSGQHHCNFTRSFWCQKTRVPRLLCRVVCVMTHQLFWQNTMDGCRAIAYPALAQHSIVHKSEKIRRHFLCTTLSGCLQCWQNEIPRVFLVFQTL